MILYSDLFVLCLKRAKVDTELNLCDSAIIWRGELMKKKLLIVDNVMDRREALKAALSQEYDVLEAEDGCQGLET